MKIRFQKHSRGQTRTAKAATRSKKNIRLERLIGKLVQGDGFCVLCSYNNSVFKKNKSNFDKPGNKIS